MNKVVKYILLTLAFVGVFVLAIWGYRNLDKIYTPSGDQYATSDTEDPTSEGTETEDPVDLAPDFTVYDENGAEVKLSDYYGRPIVVNFWATWCSPCKREMPAFDSMYEKYGEDVVFLMVNLTDGYQDTVKRAGDFVLQNGYSFPILFDIGCSAADAYGVYSIPRSLFIDPRGEISHSHTGTMSEGQIEKYIKEILGN
jgi:thiol-disulfide isomerase/thioredoxin